VAAAGAGLGLDFSYYVAASCVIASAPC